MCRITRLAICLLAATWLPNAANASSQEATVRAAADVFNSTMASPMSEIPQRMLADAHAVAIIPNVIKGGFVVGARRGHGLLFVREQTGVWHAPIFITLTGGNIGWQVGVQSSDIILVFKTERSVQGVLSGTLTLGADAAAAAGPVGRQGGIATDATLGAEIYSYSRSRGLFAGVSIDGSVVRTDTVATGSYYGATAPGQPMVIPPAAAQLTQTIAAYAGAAEPDAAPTPPESAPISVQAPIAQRYGESQTDLLREQLSELAPELFAVLDPQWKSYLALPSEVFLAGGHPGPAELQQTVEHFDRVANDPQFAALAARPEFRSVYGVLKHYQQSMTPAAAALSLPPPPQ
jgi:lipid-binding SYLF domain-containing protein